MNKLMTVAFASLACVAVAQEPVNAPAGERPGPMRERGRMMERGMRTMHPEAGGDHVIMAVMNPKVAEAIGLSKEVQLKIKEIDLDSRKAIREEQKKMRDAMEKQAKLMSADKIDEAAVMSAIDELFEVRKSVAKAQTKRVIAVRALLTPEQLKQATEEMRKFREERRAKHTMKSRPAAPERAPADGKGEVPPPPPAAE